MRREPGFMGLAKQRAKKKIPLTPEQQAHQQQVGKMIQADQAQSKGMKDKMMAWAQLQEDKDRMVQVPEQYETSQGETEQLAYVTPEEMKMLKEQGGSGEMTPYGVPSFEKKKKKKKEDGRIDDDHRIAVLTDAEVEALNYLKHEDKKQGFQSGNGPFIQDLASKNTHDLDYYEYKGMRIPTLNDSDDGRKSKQKSRGDQHGRSDTRSAQKRGGSRHRGRSPVRGGRGEGPQNYGPPGSTASPGASPGRTDDWGGGGSGGGNPYGPPPPPKTPEQIEAERKAAAKKKWDAKRKADTEKWESGKLDRERERHTKGVMKDAQGRTMEDRGVMTDAEGRVEGDEGFDFETAELKGGYDASTGKRDTSGSYEGYKGEYKELGKEFGEDKEKLAGYQSKFDSLAGDAKTAADKGAGKMEGLGEQYKGITGDAIAAEAKKGQTGFEEGAAKIGGLETGTKDIMGRQAGYEGQIAGMAEKVASGEAGQSQAAMLQGQMEHQRMAGQKGSEEKLRRELAQSGASPAEIAAKVAQFQKQSASDQSMASRSEALSSQLQGQQMGQAQMGAAAGLMGQALGATGQQMQGQAQLQSQGAQQAALRGQAAGMGMQGAQAQQSAQLQSLQGQAAMAQGAYGMQSQGISQQAGMMGQGMGAIQAAGQARGQQAGMIGEQAGMTQAQLNDVIAQQTQQFQESESEKQRKANAAAQSGGGGGGGGGILGGVTRALGISDIRLKDSIELLQKGIDGEPNIYSFKYKWDSKTTWSGVMAQELIGTKHADAVRVNPEGYYMVDYHKLGIPMVQLS